MTVDEEELELHKSQNLTKTATKALNSPLVPRRVKGWKAACSESCTSGTCLQAPAGGLGRRPRRPRARPTPGSRGPAELCSRRAPQPRPNPEETPPGRPRRLADPRWRNGCASTQRRQSRWGPNSRPVSPNSDTGPRPAPRAPPGPPSDLGRVPPRPASVSPATLKRSAAACTSGRHPRRGLPTSDPAPSWASADSGAGGQASRPAGPVGGRGPSVVGRATAVRWAAAPRPPQAAKPPEPRIRPALPCRPLPAKPGPAWRW